MQECTSAPLTAILRIMISFSNIFQEPWDFAIDLIQWADEKGVSLRQDSVGAILNARFVPENVSIFDFSNSFTNFYVF